GLVVAADPDLVVNGTATVQAEPGADAIVVTDGDLASGDNALTISLNVTATKPGTYSNGPTNITVHKGLDSPDVTTVTFTDPAPVPSDLVVRYVDEQGNPLADEDTRSGNVGETYTTAAKDIPGYELVATPANASGTMELGTEVVYVYKKIAVVPVDPIDPVLPIDPVDPVDPIVPVDPIDPIDPVVPVDPTTPVTSAGPVDSHAPARPDVKTSTSKRLASTGSSAAAAGGIAAALALAGAALVLVRRRGHQEG
ncbi:MAG TPA: MucBP domain-containing protein, partial [Cellulomonas sp.]|nr:MucBP domain-containing protein [Cellulomonas sp.]